MSEEEVKKSDTALREEEVLSFWKKDASFEKSLEKDAPNGEFVFYDGPPFATGLPHHGSLLSSIIKDVVPRYKTMRGYRVRRRWGWDTHGLPIENLVEKELGLKTKKDILDIGIAKFNETARSLVLKYVADWKTYVERVGRWVDYDNSYKTMDNTYIESVWWALKQLWEKGLLYEGKKVLMYCPHCETPLAKAEIAADNTYKDVTEEAVTVKFKVKDPEKYNLPENTYFLAWTTTPWTLPGNVGLATGSDIDYSIWNIRDVTTAEEETILVATARVNEVLDGEFIEPNGQINGHFVSGKGGNNKEYHLLKRIKGEEVTGIEYEPLYEVSKVASHTGKKHVVMPADFVTTEDGTGIVHTAVMYGEDDYQLGQKEGLPMVQLLNPNGTYNDDAPEFVRGKYIKDAEKEIKRDLDTRGLLFARDNNTHSYPHCWRCGTPLIYNAVSSWFINIQKVKEKMLSENQKINWVPEHLKNGRFGNIVDGAPDWTISRNRFWASPLPIWKEKGGDGVLVVGGLDDLRTYGKKSGNAYFMMRHGESVSNAQGVVSARKDNTEDVLTEKGRTQVMEALAHIPADINLIVHSGFARTKETAELIANEHGLSPDAVIEDARIGEVDVAKAFEGKTWDEYNNSFATWDERYTKILEGMENRRDVQVRTGELLYDFEKKYQGKKILFIGHGGSLFALMCAARGADPTHTKVIHDEDKYLENAEVRSLEFAPLPHNAHYELDLHRPYTDDIVLVRDGKEYERIPEVVDCWVESGAMPFAEYHYPFENQSEFEKRAPGDFIAEYIAQTRTWFYYMHAMGVLLFDRLAFRNVVTTGNLLAANGEKISKSKRNYTDPLALIDQYGSDAVRLYLMGSPVMQSEDVRFRDEDVREMHNRFVGILWNTTKFYALYKEHDDASRRGTESTHVLDEWIRARLAEATMHITDAMDAYDMPRAVREMRVFVDEYSTWYVRRSRERVKVEGDDQRDALATQRHVLSVFSRLIAPIAPFLAESMWKEIGGEGSVHNAPWPDALVEKDEELLSVMRTLRHAVSRALEARNTAGIKVRQPLLRATLRTPFTVRSDELLSIFKDEVNVKEVTIDPALSDDVVLNTVITDELKQEGEVRDIIRFIQDARKMNGFSPHDYVSSILGVPPEIRPIVEASREDIMKAVGADELTVVDAQDRYVNLEKK